MKKIILAGLTAGIVITIWQFAAWMFLSFHKDTIKITPNEEAVTAVLSNSITEEGVYGIPNENQQRSNAEEQKKWEEKFRRGPLATIYYRPTGDNPAMTSQLVIGILIQIIAAMFAAWLLSRSTASTQSYISRVSYVGMLGIFASIVTHISYWNWMYFPFKYTTAMMADLIIGWVIGGLVIAAFIKPLKVSE
jgi:hypothetical protein